MSKQSQALALSLVTLLLAGCASHSSFQCGAGEHAATSEQLYLGTGKRDDVVSQAELDAFLRDVVTPRFPQGFSVARVDGQWRGNDGVIVHEASYVVSIVHAGDAQSAAAVQAIAQDYKQRFAQEAVLHVRTPACMAL